jgi:hypothetical protein
MPARTSGDRHPLLIYRRALGRYRSLTLLLTLTLLGLWRLVVEGLVTWPATTSAPWLLAGGLASLVVFTFTWLGPLWAYVQPRGDHLRLQTPIYRMTISYRRVVNTRPVDLLRMFPPSTTRGSDRRILQPFYGKPALGIDLRGLPLRPLILRLFFHRLLFAGDAEGLILIVKDWMGLSNQLSSRMDTWRASQQARPRGRGIGVSLILGEDEPSDGYL